MNKEPLFWFYGFGQMYFRLTPFIGNDEWGRCTVAIPFFTAAMIIAIPKFIHRCPEEYYEPR